MNRRTLLKSTLAFGVLRYLPGCSGKSPGGGSEVERNFVAIRDRYFLKVLELNPVTATYLGGSGYDPSLAQIDGRLRDYRAPALETERTYYLGIRDELAALKPTGLSPVAQVDLRLLQAQLDFMLHQIQDLHYYQRAVDSYVAEPFRGVDWQIQGMSDGPEDQRRHPRHRRRMAHGGRTSARHPAYLEAAKENLEAGKSRGKHPRSPDDRARWHHRRQGQRRVLPEDAAADRQAGFWAAAVLPRRCSATSRPPAESQPTPGRSSPDSCCRPSTRPTCSDRFAAGETEYDWRLEHCLQEQRTAAQLYDYGAEQVTLFEQKLFVVAEEVAKEAGLTLAFGTDAEKRAGVRAVMEHLSKDSPKNDDELFQWYREAGERAVAYGREQQLFDIPADYRLEVTPTPPVLRSTIDAAYYPAPPFKKTGVGRFYLSPTGNDPATLKLNNRASVADTAVHEGFPGHDWHYKYMTQHAAEISQHPLAHPGRGGRLFRDVAGLDGDRGLGALQRRADGRAGSRASPRLLHRGGASL